MPEKQSKIPLIVKGVINYFDKLEDNIRGRLSQHPIVYAFIGSFSIALFWHGVSKAADKIEFLTGPVTIILSTIIMLATGLFVSFFVGDSIIISGLKKQKKMVEMAKEKIKTDSDILSEIHNEVEVEEISLIEIKKEIKEIKEILKSIKKP